MLPFAFQSDPPAVSSSWKQQGPAIVGDGVYDEFGRSVALSADASTLVIGASDYYLIGGGYYVKVYRTDGDGGNWVQIGQTLSGNGTEDYFGYSVDISADGMTIICGSPAGLFSDDPPGYVRVFSLEGDVILGTDTWKQIGQDIIGEANGDRFGSSVSISRDGKTIAVGATFNNGNTEMYLVGHVRIYRLEDDGTSWEQIGEDIDGEAAYDELGHSVSLSANGSTIVIGASSFMPDSTGFYVEVYHTDNDGGNWVQIGQTLSGNAEDCFGHSIDITADGMTIICGSPGEYGVRPGYVRVFSLEGDDILGMDTWKQIGQDIIGETKYEELGLSVSISDDGKVLAVGAKWSKRVRVYRMNDSESGWVQLGDDINAEYETSVSLSGDGNKVSIGSQFYDDNGKYSGSVRVYVWE